MDDAEVRDDGVVHVLPEEWAAVEGIEGDAVRTVEDKLSVIWIQGTG